MRIFHEQCMCAQKGLHVVLIPNSPNQQILNPISEITKRNNYILKEIKSVIRKLLVKNINLIIEIIFQNDVLKRMQHRMNK